MNHEPTLAKVQLTEGLGHAGEAHTARAVLDTDDIEVLREALAVAWGDLLVVQLKCIDRAAEIARLKGHAVTLAETARQVEQERCAKLCREYAAQAAITDFQRHTAKQLAAAIEGPNV